MNRLDDLGEICVSASVSDFGSIAAAVCASPWAKGIGACAIAGAEALGVPINLVWLLAALFVADFCLGLWLAVERHHFSLRKFGRGMMKIPVYTLILSLAWLCQHVVGSLMPGAAALPIPAWTVAYLCMHDGISCLRKAEALKLPVPALVKRALERVNGAAERKVEEALDALDGGDQKPKKQAPKDDGAFKKL